MPVAGVPALALEEERRLVIDLLCSLMDLGRIEPCIPYLPTENRSGCAAYLSAPVSPALSLLEGKISVASFLLKQLERAVNPARQVRALGQKWESRHEQCSAHQVVARAEVVWAARAEEGRSEAARAEADCRSELARSELAQAAATRAAATARAVACFVPTGASSSGCVPLEMRCALVRDQRVLDHLIYPIRLYAGSVHCYFRDNETRVLSVKRTCGDPPSPRARRVERPWRPLRAGAQRPKRPARAVVTV